MKDDLRLAKITVKQLCERGEKEYYIDKCDLEPRDLDILKRRVLKKQSLIEVSEALHISPEAVQNHYRAAMLVLCAIIRKYRS